MLDVPEVTGCCCIPHVAGKVHNAGESADAKAPEKCQALSVRRPEHIRTRLSQERGGGRVMDSH